MPTMGTANLGAPIAITAWSAFALWIILNLARDIWRSHERRRHAYYEARLLAARATAQARAQALQANSHEAQRLAERRAWLAKRHEEITWLDRLYEMPPAPDPLPRPGDQQQRRSQP